MAESVKWSDLMDQAGPEASASFEVLPAGVYNLEVVECTNKISAADNRYWSVQSKVLGGDHNGRRIFDNITLVTSSEGALNFFFRKMKVLGLPRNYFDTNPTDEQIANAIVGRRYVVKTKQEAYNGDMKAVVDSYLKPLEVEVPGNPVAPPAAATPPGVYAPPPSATPPPVASAPSATIPPPALESLPF